MALSFHPNIRRLFLGKGISSVFSSTFAISVYSGTQPSAASITANWPDYNQSAGNFLAHYTGAAWVQPAQGTLLQLVVPAAATVERTGTAGWAILWATNADALAVAGTSLPTPNFLVVPCSNALEQGVIRFEDPALVQGASVAILDGSIGAYAD